MCPSPFTPPAYKQTARQYICPIGRFSGQIASVLQVQPPTPSLQSRMSRQLTQLPTPDLPAGASPQFGSCTQPAGSLTGGHVNSMAGLKSLLQQPMKGDHRLKNPCDSKGEELCLSLCYASSTHFCCSITLKQLIHSQSFTPQSHVPAHMPGMTSP